MTSVTPVCTLADLILYSATRTALVAARRRPRGPAAARLFLGRRETQPVSHRQGLSARYCLWTRHLASGVHRGGQGGSFHPVLWGLSTCGLPVRAVVPGQRRPDGWLRQHGQEYADLVPESTPGHLPAPRVPQTPEETRGYRVPGL